MPSFTELHEQSEHELELQLIAKTVWPHTQRTDITPLEIRDGIRDLQRDNVRMALGLAQLQRELAAAQARAYVAERKAVR
jgi:hypothetical protein